MAHLRKGKTVLVRLFVLQLKVVQGLALRWRLRQRLDDLHKVGGEEAMDSAHLPVEPVLVHLPPQDDNVPFAELQVSWFFTIVVVQSFGTGQLRYTLKTA